MTPFLTTNFTTNNYNYSHPPMTYVPKRNTGKSFERPVKILRGLQRLCENLAGVASVVALTLWF